MAMKRQYMWVDGITQTKSNRVQVSARGNDRDEQIIWVCSPDEAPVFGQRIHVTVHTDTNDPFEEKMREFVRRNPRMPYTGA